MTANEPKLFVDRFYAGYGRRDEVLRLEIHDSHEPARNESQGLRALHGAAPPLVRAIFRLPDPERKRRTQQRRQKKEVSA